MTEGSVKKYKIAVIGTRGFPGVQGGIEYHCEHLYTRLVQNGCDVTAFTRLPYVDPSSNEYKGVKLVPIDCPKSKFSENIIHSFKAVMKARKLRPDIIHIHSSFIFALLAKMLGIKTVLTIHCQSYKHKKWGFLASQFLRLNEWVGMIFADKIIAISQPITSALMEQYGRQVTFIPNGIEIPEPVSTRRILEEHGLSKGRYILFVGRFAAGKGLEELITAFSKKELDGWKLVLAGRADHEGKYSKGLYDMVRNNGRIVLTGYITGIPLRELYTHAGIFVLPSYYEGLPIVMLEALSYGLQCIASDIPANLEIGLNRENYFRVGDAESLALKLGEFINKEMPREEKEKQIKAAAEKYSWERISLETMKIYEEALKRE
ncbi:MAG: glycosyltransferase family 4 protein [Nitrospirae bacterium]|nr:glycosyltransferase family 4 protein [Nitrospirota bacterium]